MNKSKKRAVIIAVICIILLVGSFVLDYFLGKNYFVELKYNQVIEKVNNKDSFILLLSQTTCSHCKDYKPKLERVANKYKVYVYYMEVDLLSTEEVNTFKQSFNYSGTPTTIFVFNGEEKTAANRIDGDVSEEKIISKFKSNGFIK